MGLGNGGAPLTKVNRLFASHSVLSIEQKTASRIMAVNLLLLFRLWPLCRFFVAILPKIKHVIKEMAIQVYVCVFLF
jgi:hypothetical protein